MEATLVSSRKDGGIKKHLTEWCLLKEGPLLVVSNVCISYIRGRSRMYTTNFLPLIELCKSLGATYMYLEDMNIVGNAKYISERFMQESIQALAEIISQGIIQSLQASPFFSVH